MFTKLGPNDAASADGFTIRLRCAPFRIEYEEDDGHSAVVGFDIGGRDCSILYAETLQEWLPPHQNEPFSDAQKKTILQNIANGLKFLGLSFKVYFPAETRVSGTRFESDEGFSVEIFSEREAKYAESQRSITFPVSAQGNSGLRVMLVNLRKWDVPYASEPIEDAKIMLIHSRIAMGMSALGVAPFVLDK